MSNKFTSKLKKKLWRKREREEETKRNDIDSIKGKQL